MQGRRVFNSPQNPSVLVFPPRETFVSRPLPVPAFFNKINFLSDLFECRDSVTSNFPDGKFSRPRLAAFALYFVQTHASLRLSRPDESQAVGFLILSLCCSNAGTRTPIAGARNQCPTVRRHSIYIVYYTLYVISIQGVGLF